MLINKPIGADEDAIRRWVATNRMSVDIFFAFWQKVTPELEFPGTQAGDEVSYAEWTKGRYKYQGTRNAGGQKHGIVRTIEPGDWIEEVTYLGSWGNKEMILGSNGLNIFKQ